MQHVTSTADRMLESAAAAKIHFLKSEIMLEFGTFQ
jgi:hypothetical protein